VASLSHQQRGLLWNIGASSGWLSPLG
jgi:hypothetical protein